MQKEHNYRNTKVETLLQIELYSEQIQTFEPYVWITVKPYYFTRTEDTNAIDFLPNDFCNGYHLDGLVYSAGASLKSFADYDFYSTDLNHWTLKYGDNFRGIQEYQCRKMLKTLTSVNKKLKKAEEKIGRFTIPTHWIMGIASALKVSTLLFQEPGSHCSDKNGWVECKSNRIDELQQLIHEKSNALKTTAIGNLCASGEY